jgi:hypothetical protein
MLHDGGGAECFMTAAWWSASSARSLIDASGAIGEAVQFCWGLFTHKFSTFSSE